MGKEYAVAAYSSRSYAARVINELARPAYEWQPEEKVILRRHGIKSIMAGEPAMTMLRNDRLERAAKTLGLETQYE